MKDWFSDSNIQEGLMVRLFVAENKVISHENLGVGPLPCICNDEGHNIHQQYRS